MKFEGNQAWKQAVAWVSANRDVLIALAGVFFLLPSLAVSLFVPQPTPTAGMTADQIMTLTVGWYTRAMPYIIAMLLLQALGILTILTLLTDLQRPTVGVAIRRSVSSIFAYIAAQLLIGLTIGVVGGIIAFIAGLLAASTAPGMVALIKLLFVVMIAAIFIYVFVRSSLSGPVIAVEKVRNPITALVRSWRLTSGNVIRMLLFYVLIAVVFLVMFYTTVALTGIVAALVLGAKNAVLVSTVISSALVAIGTVYFIAILAAAHRQLADPTLSDPRTTFH